MSTTVVSPRPSRAATIGLEQGERVVGGVEVVRPAADDAAQRVGGDDLLAPVARRRPRWTCPSRTRRPGRPGPGRAAARSLPPIPAAGHGSVAACGAAACPGDRLLGRAFFAALRGGRLRRAASRAGDRATSAGRRLGGATVGVDVGRRRRRPSRASGAGGRGNRCGRRGVRAAGGRGPTAATRAVRVRRDRPPARLEAPRSARGRPGRRRSCPRRPGAGGVLLIRSRALLRSTSVPSCRST